MKVIAATKNKGKIREMREIFAPLGIEIIPQREAGIEIDPEETGSTFNENALIKARAVRMVCDYPVLADDSGLCVDCLDGAPGVFSSRYAGKGATDSDKIEKLLSEIGDNENRRAHFSTCIAFITEEDEEIVTEGRVEGYITDKPQGENGFGYDPVFFSDELGKTFANATDEEKNSVSHRGRALRKLYEILKNRG